MNREEASFILANIDRRVCDDELNEALDMAIKALEQEPKTGHCTNQVYSKGDMPEYTVTTTCDDCKYKPKQGEWISHRHGCEYECDQCHVKQRAKSKYCPSCGARMVEPQESEEE